MSQIEPSAALRQAAKGLREMYVALTNEGFTPAEALAIIGYAVSASIRGGKS